jgi:hypothetical protein
MLIRNSFRFLKLKLHLIKEYYLLFINFLSSIHESRTDHPAVIFLTNRVLSKRIFPRKNPVFNYVNKFISTLIEAALLITATGVLCFIIYYTFGMLWYAYLSTPMADNFISLHPERAETIFEFSELNLIYFSIENLLCDQCRLPFSAHLPLSLSFTGVIRKTDLLGRPAHWCGILLY